MTIGGVCLLLLILVRPVIVARFRNDVLSDFFLEQLMTPMPGGGKTAVYKTFSEIGILVGNGNHCDFFQLVVFKSTLGREEILAFYDQFGERVYFLKEDEKEILNLLSDYCIDDVVTRLKREIAETAAQKETYFLRYSFVSLESNADWRCH